MDLPAAVECFSSSVLYIRAGPSTTPTTHEMKTPVTTKGFPRGLLLLSLSAWPVGCFITYTRSTAQQQLRPAEEAGRCVNRPLQQRQRLQPTRSRGVLETHAYPPNRAVDASMAGFGGERRPSGPSRAESAAGMTRFRQVS